MNIHDDIKSRWDEFTSGKINAMKLMEEYVKKEHSHLPVEQIHNEYVRLKSDKERLEKEIVDKITGRFLLEGSYVNEDKENVPAVYYTYSTKTSLVASLKSELWSVTSIVAELQGELSWANYLKTL